MEKMQTGANLAMLVAMSERMRQVYKADLEPGDCMVVETCNSTYTMRVLGEGWFEITGGWFDRKGRAPMRVRINGCTWGGSTVKVNIAAACGLCLEFGNRVVTSPIQRISIFPHGSMN